VPRIGGLPPESGLTLGLEYRHDHLAGDWLDFRAVALASHKKYEQLEVTFDLPRLRKERLFAGLSAKYRNYPEDDFWGLGPRTDKNHRTTFRLEDVNYSGTFGVRPSKQLKISLTGGLVEVNTGPGKDKDFPSIEQRFTPEQVPALDRQPDYFHFGTALEFDYRDRPGDPRSGGDYTFRWTHYGDRDFSRYSFRRYDVELRQFIPVFERSVVAARGLAVVTDTSPGQQVPFFLQGTVGGGNDLRGFSQYRFRDRNLFVFNLEYRQTVHEYVDLVAFADAGKVFRRAGQFGLSGLEGSAGVAARLKIRERVLFGVDVGVSREGVHLWFRSSHTF